jgi:hypothetical protein
MRDAALSPTLPQTATLGVTAPEGFPLYDFSFAAVAAAQPTCSIVLGAVFRTVKHNKPPKPLAGQIN